MDLTPLIQHLNNGLPFPRFRLGLPVPSFELRPNPPTIGYNVVYKHDELTPEFYLVTIRQTVEAITIVWKYASRDCTMFNLSDPELLSKIKQHLVHILNLPHSKWKD